MPPPPRAKTKYSFPKMTLVVSNETSFVFQIHFYLFIPETCFPDKKIVSINICDVKNCPLVNVPNEKNMWYGCVEFNCDPMKNDCKYNYSLTTNDDTYCNEWIIRDVKRKFQFDVFRPPKESTSHYQMRVEWYVIWLLQFVDDSRFLEILTHSKTFKLKPLKSGNNLKNVLSGILENVSDASITDIQRFYLLAILCRISKYEPLNLNDKTACDKLLQCLLSCHYMLLPESYLKSLKKLAVVLVKNSNSPGWLTFAAHFYPFFEIEFFNKNGTELPEYSYGEDEYRKMTGLLFARLKDKKLKNRDDGEKVLQKVFKSAPSIFDILNDVERPEISTLFKSEFEKVRFFVKFFTTALKDGKVNSLEGTPFRDLLSKFLDFYATQKKAVQEEAVSFIFAIKKLDMEYFTETLKELSKSVSNQRLLLHIFEEKDFWNGVFTEKQVDIFQLWVHTNIMGSQSEQDKFNLVLRSIDDVTQHCRDAENYQYLVNKLCTDVLKEFSFSEDPNSILEGFVDIEKLSSVVQASFINKAKNVLSSELQKSPQVYSSILKYAREYSSKRYVYFLAVYI